MTAAAPDPGELLSRLSNLLGVEVTEVRRDLSDRPNDWIDLHPLTNPYSGDSVGLPSLPRRTRFVIQSRYAVVRVTSGQVRNPRTLQEMARRCGRPMTRPVLNAGDGHLAIKLLHALSNKETA